MREPLKSVQNYEEQMLLMNSLLERVTKDVAHELFGESVAEVAPEKSNIYDLVNCFPRTCVSVLLI